MIKIKGYFYFSVLLFCSFSIFPGCNSKSAENLEPANEGVSRADSWWEERHRKAIAADNSKAKVLFLGDSITQNWEEDNFGLGIWQQHYGDRAVNLGFSGDKTQHLLWRIENGEIDSMSPDYTVLLIGTNNAQDYSAQEIASGVNAIIDVIEKKLPDTQLILHRIFPRGEVTDPLREVIDTASEQFSQRAQISDKITYLDINEQFLDVEGNIPKYIMADGLHPINKRLCYLG